MNITPASPAMHTAIKSGTLIFLLIAFNAMPAYAGDLTVDGHLIVNSNLTVDGIISGNGGGLTDVPCSGIPTNEADSRYVNIAGDTMTGPLTNLSSIIALSFCGVSNSVYGADNIALGGSANIASGSFSIVVGGRQNRALGTNAFIGGGMANEAGKGGVIAGGTSNIVGGYNSTICGGQNNEATNEQSFVGGGSGNHAGALRTAILGGEQNSIPMGPAACIGGGLNNIVRGSYSVIGGGYYNTIDGAYSTIPGGRYNYGGANRTFAAGSCARAIHNSAFVWSDSQEPVYYYSHGSNTVNMNASCGFWFDGGSIHGNGGNLTNLQVDGQSLDSRYANSTGGVFGGAVTIQTNLIVNGSAMLAYVPQQGDISMGIYTNQAP